MISGHLLWLCKSSSRRSRYGTPVLISLFLQLLGPCVSTLASRRGCHLLVAMAGSVTGWPRPSTGPVQAGVGLVAGSGATRFSLGSSAWQRRTFRLARASAACCRCKSNRYNFAFSFFFSSLMWIWYWRSSRAFAWRVCPSAVCQSGPVARSGPGRCAGHLSPESPQCWRAGGKSPLFFRQVCKEPTW